MTVILYFAWDTPLGWAPSAWIIGFTLATDVAFQTCLHAYLRFKLFKASLATPTRAKLRPPTASHEPASAPPDEEDYSCATIVALEEDVHKCQVSELDTDSVFEDVSETYMPFQA